MKGYVPLAAAIGAALFLTECSGTQRSKFDYSTDQRHVTITTEPEAQ